MKTSQKNSLELYNKEMKISISVQIEQSMEKLHGNVNANTNTRSDIRYPGRINFF